SRRDGPRTAAVPFQVDRVQRRADAAARRTWRGGSHAGYAPALSARGEAAPAVSPRSESARHSGDARRLRAPGRGADSLPRARLGRGRDQVRGGVPAGARLRYAGLRGGAADLRAVRAWRRAV